MKNFLIIFVLIAMFVMGLLCGKREAKIVEKETVKFDTITINNVKYDTIYKTSTKVVYLPKIDTINTTDTITTTDSVLVAVPIYTYNFYKDSLYNIEATGYNVALNKVELYNKTTTIERIQYKKYRFGVGIHAGYGISNGGLQPYLGIGINYNILNIK